MTAASDCEVMFLGTFSILAKFLKFDESNRDVQKEIQQYCQKGGQTCRETCFTLFHFCSMCTRYRFLFLPVDTSLNATGGKQYRNRHDSSQTE